MSNPLRRLYDWTMAQAASPHAEKALAGVSFAESSFFPIPPDIMLIPMVVAQPVRAWRLALICTLASVVGGVAGYLIGWLLWDMMGQPIVAFYHLEDGMATLKSWYDTHGAWVVLVAGFTPLPYKLFTIASGVFGFAFWPFVVLSALSRGARFYLVAGLLRWGGPTLRRLVEQHLELLTVALAVLLVAGFALVTWVV